MGKDQPNWIFQIRKSTILVTFLGNKHKCSPWSILRWRTIEFKTRAIKRICCTSVSVPFFYFQQAMRLMLLKTFVLREIHCSNYFGAVWSPFVQKQKELLAWKRICLKVNRISESPCNIKLWNNVPPPEFVSLEWEKQLPRFLVPEFLAKFSANNTFCRFPSSLHIPIELFHEVQAIIDAANGESEQNY